MGGKWLLLLGALSFLTLNFFFLVTRTGKLASLSLMRWGGQLSPGGGTSDWNSLLAVLTAEAVLVGDKSGHE